ncbi:MAG: MarR family winged helix-turn-helix transcriptional regulator [Desertimonas sp.]
MDQPEGAPPAASAETAHRDLVELSTRFAHAFARWLDAGSDDGLTYPRLGVLEVLHCRGPQKMKDLADLLGLSARNLTTAADALEADGLVRRSANPCDRRSTLLELTPTGQAAADESLEPRLSRIGRLFDRLSPTARADLRRSLRVLVAAMDDAGDAGTDHATPPAVRTR